MKSTKTKNVYKISEEKILSTYFLAKEAFVARELPEEPGYEQPIQTRFLNDAVGFFLKRFVKVYGPEEFTDEDRVNMRRHLEMIFEAKDAITPREPKGGMYLRQP